MSRRSSAAKRQGASPGRAPSGPATAPPDVQQPPSPDGSSGQPEWVDYRPAAHPSWLAVAMVLLVVWIAFLIWMILG